MALWLFFVRLLGAMLRPKVLTALIAVTLIAAGVFIMRGAEPLPIPFLAGSRPEQDKASQALFALMMKNHVWAEGYSQPSLIPPERPGQNPVYWAIFRGTIDNKSHVDADGKPVSILCLHLYVKGFEHDEFGRLAPHPYFLGFLTWPEVLVKCAQDYRENKDHELSDPPFMQYRGDLRFG